MSSSGTSLFLTGRSYDALKWVALIFLPAFGAFYYSLSGIWNLPAAEQVVGTIVITETFVGLLVGASHRNYQKSDAWADGEMVVHREDGVPVSVNASLNHVVNPLNISDQEKVTFKVVHNDFQV